MFNFFFRDTPSWSAIASLTPNQNLFSSLRHGPTCQPSAILPLQPKTPSATSHQLKALHVGHTITRLSAIPPQAQSLGLLTHQPVSQPDRLQPETCHPHTTCQPPQKSATTRDMSATNQPGVSHHHKASHHQKPVSHQPEVSHHQMPVSHTTRQSATPPKACQPHHPNLVSHHQKPVSHTTRLSAPPPRTCHPHYPNLAPPLLQPCQPHHPNLVSHHTYHTVSHHTSPTVSYQHHPPLSATTQIKSPT